MTQQPIELYDYQQESIERLRKNIKEGKKNQVLAAPTGSGKTVCAARLLDECRKKGKRAVFVCDRIPLIEQTSRTLDQYGIPHGVIQADHWRKRIWEPIQVASAQTLARRGWPGADLVVVDECHTISKTVLRRIVPRDVITIGLTATPFTRGLGRYYDEVVTVTTTKELTDRGYLAPFRVFAASEPDMTGARVKLGEWSAEDAESRALPIVGDVVAEYLKHGENRKFIAFGCTVAHCQELHRQFMASGVQVALYTYQTSDEERRLILEEYEKPDSYIRGLISVSALAKGFDVPDVSCIIMARPLRSSLAEHIQILGRGLRRHPDKRDCIVLDHAGNCVRFWNPMQEFFENGVKQLDDGKRRERKAKARKEPKPMKCFKCHHVHTPRPSCPECGYEYPRPVRVKHLAGQLMELTGASKPGNERRALYAQLLYLARERGKRNGDDHKWVLGLFKARTGDFPPRWFNGSIHPAEPTKQLRNWVLSRRIAFAKAQQSQTRRRAA